MADFENAVDELKILKDNKTKVLNDTAASVGKVIISKDELDELLGEVEKLKNSHKETRAGVDEVVNDKVKALIEHRLKLQ